MNKGETERWSAAELREVAIAHWHYYRIGKVRGARMAAEATSVEQA